MGGSLLEWISNYSRRAIDPFIWTDCKLTYFCWYFFHHFSSAMLVIMSIEKCFALYFPLKTKGICTVKTTKWATFLTVLSLASFNAQFFLSLKRITQREKGTGVTLFKSLKLMFLHTTKLILSCTHLLPSSLWASQI